MPTLPLPSRTDIYSSFYVENAFNHCSMNVMVIFNICKIIRILKPGFACISFFLWDKSVKMPLSFDCRNEWMNEWCFRPRLCTLRLYWAGDNLGSFDFDKIHLISSGCPQTSIALLQNRGLNTTYFIFFAWRNVFIRNNFKSTLTNNKEPCFMVCFFF